jgi:hypothetical protein
MKTRCRAAVRLLDGTKSGGHGIESYPELINDLQELLAASRQLLTRGTVDYETAKAMAGYVAEARSLLSELGADVSMGRKCGGSALLFAALKESFFELEGRVKELRNGLTGEQRRVQ